MPKKAQKTKVVTQADDAPKKARKISTKKEIKKDESVVKLRIRVRAYENKILDASVIIKWFIEEEGSNRARSYLSAYKVRRMSRYCKDSRMPSL